MLKGTSHPPDKVVGRLRPTSFREFWELTVEKVAVNAVMAGAKPEYLPVILAHAASGVTARSSSTTSLGDDRRGQRSDPQRNRHGLRHRRDGSLQPRQRHHRPRLQSALDQRPGRISAGRHLHGLARQPVQLQRDFCGEPRSAARGSRSTCRRASSRPTARSASSSAAATPRPASGRARLGRRR